ncbi:MAG: tRNA uridine-5-carboxymethylaminomethyl(34) synthesis GTPase MnmE [Armatimonadetes bacterium]|nr:tRNA uridine-5-carboxymethylaminomethyl(34) synthesis GTPase MnmE [Armatimonadota bacterium]
MELHGFEDTIAAIATPPGVSGIGIVRVSGPEALVIADRIFRPATPGKIPSRLRTFSTRYGHIIDADGAVVDEVILTVMRAPRTYTTQDVVEINCHGGVIPVRKTLELVLSCGARLADPGEFTKRAFYFGRIDLAQAEAVADLVNARTDEARRAAVDQLQGRFSQSVNAMRETIIDLLAALEAALDYGDEGLDLLTPEQITAACDDLERQLSELIASADLGRPLREGVRAAIVGRPNVGKSSLLNALLGQERAIVTPIPGTTRDVVEDSINVAGVTLTLSDTAGLRATHDPVETAGVARARAEIDRADLVLLVMDGSEPLSEADLELFATVPQSSTILVVNKDDLPAGIEKDALERWGSRPVVWVSAERGTGLDALKSAISDMIWSGRSLQSSGVIVTNLRHKLALERARDAVAAGRKAVSDGLTEEYVASDLRQALDALADIVGLTLSTEIINRVFENFCIGK